MIRFRPDPLPAIHPLPEALAEGARRAAYEDTKAVLGVPWMGVVTMAFSHYPQFWRTLWQGLRPVCLSAEFAAARDRLRALAEAEAAALGPAPLGPALAAAGYAPSEIAEIAGTIEVFSAGNMPYALIATLVRHLMEGGSFGGGPATPAPLPVAPVAGLVLMEAHHAEPATRALYADIMARLGLPFVNTDYRALARWPSYFRLAWEGLRPHPGTPAHEAALARIHAGALGLARDLPNPAGLSADTLRAAARADADEAEVLAVVRLFQWLIPGLLLNVGYLRGQLEDLA